MAANAQGHRAAFSDAAMVERYAEGPPRIVPGFWDMHRMAAILLGERVPNLGRLLVVGAGGGLELKAFAESQPTWSFDGVDPSLEMIRLAETMLGPLGHRVRLLQGFIDIAPAGPFDGATCLLTMHFVELAERRRMASEIHRRLKPRAPFVLVHLSTPRVSAEGVEGERAVWLSRYLTYGAGSGVEAMKAENARKAIESHLTILTPEEDEAILREAGFSGISLFYAGFAFRGWVAYA